MRRARSLVAIAALAGAGLLVAPASAQEPEVGVAHVTPAEGGSTTPFRVDIPPGASCPGDSAEDGYRVNSYMVPVAVPALEVTFDGMGPTPASFGTYDTFREPLFDIDTNSFVSRQTANAEAPGDPGPILELPEFSYGVYEPGDLPPGRYRIGITCTLLNEIVLIWDAEVEVTEDADDDPAQIRWRVVSAPPVEEASDSSFAVGSLAVGAVLATGLAVFAIRRRGTQRRPSSRSLEDA